MEDNKDRAVLTAFYRVAWDLDDAAVKLAAQYGLTHSQFHVLLVLRRFARLTIGEIRDLTYSSNGTMTVIINNLEKLNLILRTKDPQDHRRSVIALTEKGKELAERLESENEKLIAERFAVWTGKEKEALAKLLRTYSDRHFSYIKEKESQCPKSN